MLCIVPLLVELISDHFAGQREVQTQGHHPGLRILHHESTGRFASKSTRSIPTRHTICPRLGLDQNKQGNARAVNDSLYLSPFPFPSPTRLLRLTQTSIADIELNHHARVSGKYTEHEAEIALANSAYKMKTYEEWKAQEKKEDAGEGNWNQASLGKLLTGRM